MDDDDDDALSDDREWSLGFLERARRDDDLEAWRFPSKAGGAPAWMDPVRVPRASALETNEGERMAFLCQVYAPVDAEASAFHRTVYVFVNGTRGGRDAREGRRAGVQGTASEGERVLRVGSGGGGRSGARADGGGDGDAAREVRLVGRERGGDEDVSRVRVGGGDGGARGGRRDGGGGVRGW